MDLFEALAPRNDEEKALPIPRYVSYQEPGCPGSKDWDARLAVRDAFKSNTWAYASIRMIARATARVPWVVKKINLGEEPTDVEAGEDNGALLALNRPNPLQGRQALIESGVNHLYLAGNAVWAKIKIGRPKVTRELHPLEPDTISPIPGPGYSILRYDYKRGAVAKSYKPEEILHFSFQDPANPYWGMSPIQAAGRVIDTDVEAIKWNKAGLENRGVPDGVFSFDEPLSDEQFDEASDMVRVQYTGAKNARAPWILGSALAGIKCPNARLIWTSSPEGSLTSSRFASAMGILPALLAPEAATYSNLQEARKSLWIDTVVPLLDLFRSILNLQLMQDFNDPGTYYYDYDLSDIDALRDEFDKRVDAAGKLADQGVPWNEASDRLQLGLDPVPGGDDPHGLNPDVLFADRLTPSVEASLGGFETKSHTLFGPSGEPIDGAEVQRTYIKLAPDSLIARENAETAELMAIAAELEPQLYELFLELVTKLREEVPEPAIEEAIARQSYPNLEGLFPFADLETGIKGLDETLKAILLGAASVFAAQLSKLLGQNLPFDPERFPTLSALERAADMGQKMTQSSRTAIEDVWKNLSVREDFLGIRASKFAFKFSFGLNRNQGKSLTKFYEGFIRHGATGADIAEQMEVYGNDLLSQRARNFARTESIVQANRARTNGYRAWKQYLTNARRTWITSRLANVCPICLPIDGQTVGLTEQFFSAFNGQFYKGPGAEYVHGDCACGELITSF